jgi:hypothetical protein
MFDYSGMRTLDEYTPRQLTEESGVAVELAADPDELVEYLRGLAHLDQRRAA